MATEFSPERRKFIKDTLGAGAAVALTPVAKITNLFENKEEDLEQKHIKDCIAEYNKKYPEMRDKIKEQKKWFLKYINSKLYKDLLTKEMERALQVSPESSNDEKKALKEFVNSELKDRRLKVKNVPILHNDYQTRGGLAYTVIINGYFRRNHGSMIQVEGKINYKESKEDILGIVVNDLAIQPDLNNFESISTVCHELHHVTLAKPPELESQPIKTTDDVFSNVLKKDNVVESVWIGKTQGDLTDKERQYAVETVENMARILAVRKTLHQLGKIRGFKDLFEEKHIIYLKKYINDLFPADTFVRYLFTKDYMKDGKEIDNQKLLDMMNSFAGVSNNEDPNTRMS